MVNSVFNRGACPNAGSPFITVDGYVLCLQLHLVERYCYVFPQGQGWVTGARCREPGTVHVIDIVPGATTGAGCTRSYRWSHWYSFKHPQAVYCVMVY